MQPPSPGTSDTSLAGVTVLSPCDAWAVGSFRSGGEDQTLILRWNGTVWKQVSRPSPGSSFSVLKGFASSPHDAWAVGDCKAQA